MSVKITDNSGPFKRKVADATDFAMAGLAAEIETLSKMQVPHEHGTLQRSGYHEKIAPRRYRIVYRTEYAMYQHEGARRDGSHVIRHHSKPDRKTHYLTDPAKLVLRNAKSKITGYLNGVRV